jgi:hypothetical protein
VQGGTVSEEEAVALAKEVADEKGWPWALPVRVSRRKPWLSRGGGRWEIFSNGNALGASVRVVINDDTGEVIERGFISR